MRIRFTALLPVVLALLAVSTASAQQQPLPGEDLWDLYKLRGRDNCSANFSCSSTYNAWYGFNGGALAQSASLKNCAQVEIETVDGGRYAVRVPLPALGAKTIPQLRERLATRLSEGSTFGLETWQGRVLQVRPRNIMNMEVERCH